MDSLFKVMVVAATPNPQQLVYAAMHQDYSEDFVCSHREAWPGEQAAGEACVRRLLFGERGHFGPLEHPQITFNCGWFPHSVMQQARTHRIGISFDVQSMRYTGYRISNLDLEDSDEVEKVFYLRPVGTYRDRNGKQYMYTEEQRLIDLEACIQAALRYKELMLMGYAEEHARGMLPFDYRQHFVVSFTLRSVLHFMDLRSKLDAQDEIRQMCELMWVHVEKWVPEIAAWYAKHRLYRARLAP